MNNHEDIQSEGKRKLFHLLTLLYPVLYNVLPRKISWIISGTFIVLDIIIESFRLSFPRVNQFLLRVFSGFYRESESNTISALVWTFTGTFLTMFIFQDSKIVTTALLYMVFGDSAAAFIGVAYGRTKIGPKKSLEGSLACFIVCILCGIFLLPWYIAVPGALIATIIEYLPLPLNDNFWLPLMSGFALTFLKRVL